ncbi:DUF1045 domain-containing protein [Roseibium denhamense]|uniref:Phosphonate metabolism protein n=1 Tax=Roseibium denhamense TaxID=76305 RepID=A0ABY1P9V5_9HYPH|nr:DUF1045 domain-containing protein [Roseibium denhamense]MTI07424.1 DUF1045 domain-containing protein [Roseibium denhamense]SMP29550.1 putative phosphonate metabolism protein [Roseibium denhamense]
MRYALYFAADSNDKLMELGNAWLGRDPFTGQEIPQPFIPDISQERLHALTESPRRYGFHGTLKAPFSLAETASEADLVAACAGFSSTISPFETNGLGVNRLGRFLALTPEGDEPLLNAFAALCVRHFEPFRGPLSAEDLERRRRANLTEKQDAYVTQWGYPYIFDEFRFHMTLSEKLDNDAEAERLAVAAANHFESVTGQPRLCRQFALYAEAERGSPFEIHTVFDLTGTTSPADAQTPGPAPTRKETV